MELADIRRKALAARAFTKEVGGVTFSLRVPTQHESSTLYLRCATHQGAMDPASLVRWQRAILLQAIVGWSGAKVHHTLSDLVDTEEGASDLAFEPGAAEVLLDAQPEWEEALVSELLERRAKRLEREEAAAKN